MLKMLYTLKGSVLPFQVSLECALIANAVLTSHLHTQLTSVLTLKSRQCCFCVENLLVFSSICLFNPFQVINPAKVAVTHDQILCHMQQYRKLCNCSLVPAMHPMSCRN